MYDTIDEKDTRGFWNVDIPSAPIIKAPEELNPFAEDGVEFFISLAGCNLPGENIKYGTVLGMLNNAQKRGLLEKTTTLIEATSGNTGLALASLATLPPFSIRNIQLVTQPDLAFGKRGPLILRGATCIDPEEDLSAIATARKLGGGGWRADASWQPDHGRLNLDQYSNPYNCLFHEKRTGLDIESQMLGRIKKTITVFCAGIGTGGTIIGVSRHLRSSLGKAIRIVGVLCKPGEKVPGVRDRARMAEITLPWEVACDNDAIHEVGTRAAYLTTQWFLWLTPYSFGPSFGFAYAGALLDIHLQKQAGNLDLLRNRQGEIAVVVLAPDTYRPYIDHFHADLTSDMLRRSTAPMPWKLLWEA